MPLRSFCFASCLFQIVRLAQKLVQLLSRSNPIARQDDLLLFSGVFKAKASDGMQKNYLFNLDCFQKECKGVSVDFSSGTVTFQNSLSFKAHQESTINGVYKVVWGETSLFEVDFPKREIRYIYKSGNQTFTAKSPCLRDSS